ncbi:WGR domain-containing protein [Acetobacter oryzoeni]|uniref:WGR domain-containing protein n=1 Tax=Acetobacter oryzoeni TaxID=2500548 RepID=UPI001FCC96C8|nr:WGR domain-containing protein [Acetobacter oryzoeni]MCP1203320.1 WGR domain-containing protein [Acetobacter oryzoeni]
MRRNDFSVQDGAFLQLALFPDAVSLVRVYPPRNTWRYYDLSIQPDLFGGAALIRRWGRIGTPGKIRLDLFPDAGAAANQLARLLRQKLKRGYIVRA